MWSTSRWVLFFVSLGATSAGCEKTPEVTGLLANTHNYSFDGSLDVPSVATVTGEDVEICWESMDLDIQCHPVDPEGDIDNVALIRFSHLAQPEIKSGMSEGTLLQADISGYVESRVGEETCTSLSDMSFFGTEIDVTEEYKEGIGTFLLLLTTGTEPALGTRMLTFLEPTAGSSTSAIEVESGCGVLDFQADLQSLSPLPLYEDGSWTVDWSGVTTDGQGLENDFVTVDRATVAWYSDHTAQDLEEDFLDLELLATQTWEKELDQGTSVDLATLVDSDGNAFGGFQQEGLWVLALRCSTCVNPAPLILTLVEPVTGGGS